MFIKIHGRTDGAPEYVNTWHIRTFFAHEEGGAVLELTSEELLETRESPEEILKAIQERSN